jgi:hypothetical protein
MTSPADLPVFTPTSPARTKVGRLRQLFDEIEQAQASGWRQESIVKALREQSLDLSVDYLKKVLARIRARRKQNPVAPAARPAETAPKKMASSAGGTSAPASVGPTVGQRESVFSPEGYRDPPPTFTRDIHRHVNLDE